jgi:hypothetical protein
LEDENFEEKYEEDDEEEKKKNRKNITSQIESNTDGGKLLN